MTRIQKRTSKKRKSKDLHTNEDVKRYIGAFTEYCCDQVAQLQVLLEELNKGTKSIVSQREKD